MVYPHLKILRHSEDTSAGVREKNINERKPEEETVKQHQRMEAKQFGDSPSVAKDNERWKSIAAMPSGIPRRPSRSDINQFSRSNNHRPQFDPMGHNLLTWVKQS